MEETKYVSKEVCSIVSELLDKIEENPNMSIQELSQIQDSIARIRNQARENGEIFPYYIEAGF